MLRSDVQIGDRDIGDGKPCFIIAEAGSNHSGSLEMALALIDAAAAAGADAVKFQVFRAARLYPMSAGVSDYLNVPTPIYDVISAMEMPFDWLPHLAARCQHAGVVFVATPFDEESTDRLDPFVDVFKIASYEMNHFPLVRHVAAKGKPVIISTGASTFEDVAELVEEFRATGNESLMLMQCTAAYPAPIESLNVRAVAGMKQAFGIPVGLSDHSRDPIVAPVTAVAVGANIVEKHFTFSNLMPGPDHRFALELDELRAMIDAIRRTEQALGSSLKATHSAEDELRAFARRSVFAVRDIAPGEVLTAENIAVLRCGKLAPGLPPKAFSGLLGRTAVRSVTRESALRSEDVR